MRNSRWALLHEAYFQDMLLDGWHLITALSRLRSSGVECVRSTDGLRISSVCRENGNFISLREMVSKCFLCPNVMESILSNKGFFSTVMIIAYVITFEGDFRVHFIYAQIVYISNHLKLSNFVRISQSRISYITYTKKDVCYVEGIGICLS